MPETSQCGHVQAINIISIEPIIEGTGGGSDANIVNGLGIPSAVLGLIFKMSTVKTSPLRLRSDESAQFVLSL